MSAQNSLKKPSFSKVMRGYSVEEVDSYLAYVNERYSSVCRESAELKRKLTRFMLGLDKPEGVPSEERLELPTESELSLLRSRLEECIKQASAVEEMLVSAALTVERVKSAEATAAFDEPKEEPDVTSEEPEPEEEYEEPFNVLPEPEPYIPSDELKHRDFKMFDELDDGFVSSFPIEIVDSNKPATDEPEAVEKEALPEEEQEAPMQDVAPVKRSAKEMLDLDFYTDESHADGESFDPMTLAAQSTSRKKKPTFEDFVRPIRDGKGS